MCNEAKQPIFNLSRRTTSMLIKSVSFKDASICAVDQLGFLVGMKTLLAKKLMMRLGKYRIMFHYSTTPSESNLMLP